jgi:hypothetical protein
MGYFGPAGYRLARRIVSVARRTAALRTINAAIGETLYGAEQLADLRYAPEVLALRENIRRGPGATWADPQVVIRPPDLADDWPLEPHTDAPPAWAAGRVYAAIFAVPLTTHALWVWPRSHFSLGGDRPQRLELHSGDLLTLHPRLEHASDLNRSAHIRIAVYFRLLAPAAG